MNFFKDVRYIILLYKQTGLRIYVNANQLLFLSRITQFCKTKCTSISGISTCMLEDIFDGTNNIELKGKV